MKKIFLMTAVISAIVFYSCKNNSSKEEYTTAVNQFSGYVDSVDKVEPVYTEQQWAMIDTGYNQHLVTIDRSTEPDTAQSSRIQQSKMKYQALRERYQVKIQEAKTPPVVIAPANRDEIRTSLLGTQKLGPNDRWDYVTPANIVGVYQDFINKVRNKSPNYKEEDWTEVRSLWKGLNDRKDEIEKDISTKDNIKIAGMRVAFTAIKSVTRPISKVKEEVKENK